MSEYRPTEYVVDFGDCRSSAFVGLAMAECANHGARLNERIVRCRDCEYLNLVSKCPCGFYALEDMDGYCKWGKRAEVDA